MNCPKCHALMNAIYVGQYQIDRCSKCRGLWFDLREHEHLAEQKDDVDRVDTGDPAVGARMNQMRDIQCPHCNVKMLKLAVPAQAHIQYESCPVCYGAFFDAGESKDYATHTLSEQVAAFFRGFKKRRAAG